MLRGILISLLASLLFGYMYYFSTLLKPLSGTDIFGYRMLFTFPFVALSVIMFKQKQALAEHLKRIKKTTALCPFLYYLWRINGLSNVALFVGPPIMVAH